MIQGHGSLISSDVGSVIHKLVVGLWSHPYKIKNNNKTISINIAIKNSVSKSEK